jgi:peptidoglycan biosynthesis protein MviN/MurJ (putative lipid II flippase)
MTQSLIAVRKSFPAILISGMRAVFTYSTGYFLFTYWDYQGIAFSFSLALVINLFLFFPVFFRLSPFGQGWKSLFVYTLKIILASSPLFLLGWGVNRWPLTEWLGFPNLFIFLVAAISSAAALLLCFSLLVLFKVKEIQPVLDELKRGWVRRKWWLAEPVE